MFAEILDRILARRQVTPPPHERRSVLSWPSSSDAGIFVSEEAALGCSTAWACGNLISRSIAMLPARVMVPRSNDEQDGAEHLDGHPVENLLHSSANPETSAFAFRESALLSAIFRGNSFAEIERDQIGRPVALWPLHPDRVQVYHNLQTSELEYEVNNGGSDRVILGSRDVFHLAGPSMHGPLGMSVISYARNTIGVALAQERFAGSFIRNQAAPSGLVTLKAPLSEKGFKRLRAEFEQLFRGPRNAGKVVFADGDLGWTAIGVSPQDAEFISQRRFSVEEVARWFGVPPQMIGVQDKQTLNNYEQASLHFLSLAVLPWVVRFEQEANRKLLTGAVRRQPYLKINTDAIVRANLQAQYGAFAQGRQWGWLSVNDIRRKLDMEPIGGAGDVYLTPMNMQPSDGAAPAQAPAARLRRLRSHNPNHDHDTGEFSTGGGASLRGRMRATTAWVRSAPAANAIAAAVDRVRHKLTDPENAKALLGGAVTFVMYHGLQIDMPPDVEEQVRHEVEHFATSAKVSTLLARDMIKDAMTSLKQLRAKSAKNAASARLRAADSNDDHLLPTEAEIQALIDILDQLDVQDDVP